MRTPFAAVIIETDDERSAPMSRRVVAITVTGEMDEVLRGQFDDVEVTVQHGVSRLCVVCPDPSVLHGVLHRIDALGLELLDLRLIDGMADPLSAPGTRRPPESPCRW